MVKNNNKQIAIFEGKKIRRVWGDEGGNETVTKCNGLKMIAADDKKIKIII